MLSPSEVCTVPDDNGTRLNSCDAGILEEQGSASEIHLY